MRLTSVGKEAHKKGRSNGAPRRREQLLAGKSRGIIVEKMGEMNPEGASPSVPSLISLVKASNPRSQDDKDSA